MGGQMGGGMGGAMVPTGMGGQMAEQASISLSAQAELELELSLRGSLLVQQQRRIVQLEDELQRAWTEIDRLRTKLSVAERDRHRTDEDSSKQPRYWTPEEHRLFMEAVQRYGWKDVKSIAAHVGTRTPTQVRTHAQKLFLRQQKESTGVMAPAKSGREMPAGIPLPETSAVGGAGSSNDQLQTLQEAGYHLAQGGGDDDFGQGLDGKSGADAMHDMGGMGGMPGMPPGMMPGDLRNPDADPNAE